MKYFLGRSRVLLLLAVFGLSSLSLSLSPLITSQANAVSSYDDVVHTTETLTIRTGGDIYDATINWRDLITEVCSTDILSQVLAAEELDGNFGVTQRNFASDNSRMELSWNVDNPYTLEFTSTTELYMDSIGGLAIEMYHGSPVCFDMGGGVPIASSSVSSGLYQLQLFKYTGAFVAYPEDYEGEIIPNTPPKEQKFPQIKYTVNDKIIVASYTGASCIQNPDEPNQCVIFDILWITNNGDGVTDDKDDTKVLTSTQDYTFTYKENGTYGLFAIFQAKGVPYAPLPEQYEYIPAQVMFEIDGSDFQGNTDTCIIDSGFCVSNDVIYCDDLDNLVDKVLCKFSNSMKTGLIAQTLSGMVSVFQTTLSVNPTHCNVTWNGVLDTSDVSLDGHSDILPLHTAPQAICDRLEPLYINDDSPFHSISVMLNIALGGAAIFFLVFGILAILGFNVHLPSPIQEEPDGALSGQGQGFGKNRTYVSGPSSKPLGATGEGRFERARKRGGRR